MLRLFHHYFSGRKLAFFMVEALAITGAGLSGAVLMAWLIAPPADRGALPSGLPGLTVIGVGMAVIFQFAMYLMDLYDLRIASEDRGRGQRWLRAVGAALVAVGLGLLVTRLPVPAGAVLGGALGALAGALVARAALGLVVGGPAGVLVVGRGARARLLETAIAEEGEGAFQVLAMLEPPAEGGTSPDEPIDEAAMRLGTEYVVMALDEPRGTRWVEALLRCRIAGKRVYDAAGFSERVLRRLPVAHLRTASLAFADELRLTPVRRASKRVFDLAMATLLLAAAAPWMVLIAIAIKLDSRGPVFYRQERVGAGGRPYRLWKFRSMRPDAERGGAVWASANDDRVTRVGRFIRKTRMDEIPQVLNVLLGEMSFVGPRPERPVFVEQLERQLPFYRLREVVKPGITGWAQIRYPYGASVEDARNKLEYDLYYVKNGSLFLDLAIIFHTVRHVLLGRGAR